MTYTCHVTRTDGPTWRDRWLWTAQERSHKHLTLIGSGWALTESRARAACTKAIKDREIFEGER